jgi:glutamate 5-kinase
MATKIEAARIVAEAGKVTVIANGRIPGVVERVVAGEAIGTVFHPRLPHAEDRA